MIRFLYSYALLHLALVLLFSNGEMRFWLTESSFHHYCSGFEFTCRRSLFHKRRMPMEWAGRGYTGKQAGPREIGGRDQKRRDIGGQRGSIHTLGTVYRCTSRGDGKSYCITTHSMILLRSNIFHWN